MNQFKKNLFELRISDNGKTKEIEEEKSEPKKNYYYYTHVYNGWKNDGFKSARNHGGSPSGLKICLASIASRYKQLLNKDEFEREKAREPYKIKLQECQAEAQTLRSRIERNENDKIPECVLEIDNHKREINNIRQNPEEHSGHKSENAGYWIGIGILVFLTLYLFLFYGSASYSAFFKNFTPENGVAESIFDANAFGKALADGVGELLLILTIPFVFLGLGYLIHKFQESSHWIKYFKIAMLVIVTFIFDCILAYEITSKIYNLKAENSFNALPEYNFALAFSEVNFWLIIFAGFVVYVIWGLVFDFVMDSHYKRDKVSIFINGIREKIKDLESKISDLKKERDDIQNQLDEVNTNIEKYSSLATNSDIIKPKELKNWINQFVDGWLEWLNSDRRDEIEKEEARNITYVFIEENFKVYDVEGREN